MPQVPACSRLEGERLPDEQRYCSIEQALFPLLAVPCAGNQNQRSMAPNWNPRQERVDVVSL